VAIEQKQDQSEEGAEQHRCPSGPTMERKEQTSLVVER